MNDSDIKARKQQSAEAGLTKLILHKFGVFKIKNKNIRR